MTETWGPHWLHDNRPLLCPLPGRLRPGLVLPRRADPTGERGPTPAQARGPHWRRTSQGRFVPAGTSVDSPEQRILEASVVLPLVGCVSGWSALRWVGGFWFTGVTADGSLRPVQLHTGDKSIRAQLGFVVSEERITYLDMRVHDGLAIASPTFATAFEMRYAHTPREAQVVFEMAAYNDLVSRAELATLLAELNGWTGIPQARSTLPHLDENYWSPQEVRLHQIWCHDAELPRMLTNRPIFDRAGDHVATPDLFDEEAGLAVDYHGAHHLDLHQHRTDRNREERIRALGIEYLSAAEGDSHDLDALVDRFHRVRARCRFAAPSEREWTTDLPRWWVPTFTVDQRRELRGSRHESWLHLRRTA